MRAIENSSCKPIIKNFAEAFSDSAYARGSANPEIRSKWFAFSHYRHDIGPIGNLSTWYFYFKIEQSDTDFISHQRNNVNLSYYSQLSI